MKSIDDLPFRLGPAIIADPLRNSIQRQGETVSVEPRVMELLIYLAKRPGEIVTKRQLMNDVWRANVVDEAIHRAVSILRAALGDPAQGSRIVETVPRRGYRLAVAPLPLANYRKRYLLAAATVATVAGLLLWAAANRQSSGPGEIQSTAVRPVEMRYIERPAPPPTDLPRSRLRDGQRQEPKSPQPSASRAESIAPQAPMARGPAVEAGSLAPRAPATPTPEAVERP